MTIGEERVRVRFNPEESGNVQLIKQKTAELIDLCEEFKSLNPRIAAIAQTTYEDAAMWAVKAATI